MDPRNFWCLFLTVTNPNKYILCTLLGAFVLLEVFIWITCPLLPLLSHFSNCSQFRSSYNSLPNLWWSLFAVIWFRFLHQTSALIRSWSFFYKCEYVEPGDVSTRKETYDRLLMSPGCFISLLGCCYWKQIQLFPSVEFSFCFCKLSLDIFGVF